jgi:hypothetical protein
MPTVTPTKAHHIDNHCTRLPRASHLKKPEPERFVTFEVLAYRMCAAFGTEQGDETRHALMRRMGIEPTGEVCCE